jgi:SAM-dependent methyltransferase
MTNDKTPMHFHMSADYEANSSTQKSIGRQVIQIAIEMATINFNKPSIIKALDLACGPGNLTIEFHNALEKNFPGVNIHTTGLDYSEMNINLLKKNYAGTISGITASFYNLPVQTKNSDIIISNEGFHWQPPYAMSKMMFSYLDSPEKENYDRFALQNLETAFRNVYGSLKTGGIGVFQFGHKGQIKKLWDLVYDIFNEDAFKEYVSKINFPVYHPTVEDILNALITAGFLRENIEINAYPQDLMEESPSAVTAFYKAFSQPGLSQYLPPDILYHFYKRMEDRFNNIDMVEFRKNLLHRTLVKVRKGTFLQ